MSWKDWLARGLFVLTLAAAVVAVVIVVEHERTRSAVASPAHERDLQKLCYENLGSGGC